MTTKNCIRVSAVHSTEKLYLISDVHNNGCHIFTNYVHITAHSTGRSPMIGAVHISGRIPRIGTLHSTR